MKAYRKILALLIVMGVQLFLPLSSVSAQSTIDLTVSPPTQEIAVKPGDETRIQIKFYNKSDDNISGFFKVADFIVLDKSGTPSLYDAQGVNNRFAASTWFTLSDEKVTIPAKDQFTLTAYIKVPSNASGCGHYTSVYFEPSTPSLGGQPINIASQSTVAFRLASLIYLNVSGQCTESAHVSKMSMPKFMEYGPIPIDLEVLNRSDYHIMPKMYLTLNDASGQQVDLKPLPEVNIFPDAVRSYQAQMGGKWMIGRYTVLVNGGYGKTGQSLASYAEVWIFPWRIMVAIVLTILVLFFLLRGIFSKISKKEIILEKELEKEQREIDKLKEQLRRRKD